MKKKSLLSLFLLNSFSKERNSILSSVEILSILFLTTVQIFKIEQHNFLNQI